MTEKSNTLWKPPAVARECQKIVKQKAVDDDNSMAEALENLIKASSPSFFSKKARNANR